MSTETTGGGKKYSDWVPLTSQLVIRLYSLWGTENQVFKKHQTLFVAYRSYDRFYGKEMETDLVSLTRDFRVTNGVLSAIGTNIRTLDVVCDADYALRIASALQEAAKLYHIEDWDGLFMQG